MGSKTYNGREGFIQFREEGWDKVASREHVVLDVFPKKGGERQDAELMLRGAVRYGMKDGSEGKADWAGHMKLQWLEDEGGYKLAFYQVWIVSYFFCRARKQLILFRLHVERCLRIVLISEFVEVTTWRCHSWNGTEATLKPMQNDDDEYRVSFSGTAFYCRLHRRVAYR